MTWETTEGSLLQTELHTIPAHTRYASCLTVTRRTRRIETSLDFQDRDLATYELKLEDGEVMLVKYEGNSAEGEIVYSEILDTETRMDYDEARHDAELV